MSRRVIATGIKLESKLPAT
eukprot:gene8023-biopygen14464